MFALINSDRVGRDGAGRVSLLRLQGLFDGADDYTADRVSDLLSA
jgi:hypothetical protein